ncbi:MAG TPA: NADPH-dependent assimilatory sulfite reductase hemoprotein subunit, partial [Planctomycetaceae bacterium]|nr:NADPH-dependent assimilatory sulfite reductase hemoprotein subunit [Planctomycetaceae bacterium]
DIGLVGKAVNKYTMFLGGNAEGTRLGFIFQDMVKFEDVAPTLSPIFAYFKAEREGKESFGDFCNRKGLEDLTEKVTAAA